MPWASEADPEQTSYNKWVSIDDLFEIVDSISP
jgi:hypothetical protein